MRSNYSSTPNSFLRKNRSAAVASFGETGRTLFSSDPHMTVESAIDIAMRAGAPEGRFRDLVLRCLDLDGDAERSARAFCQHLRAAITTFRLGRLFAWDGDGEHHRTLVSRGYNRRTGAIIEIEMMQWRADYRSLPPEGQMLAASIIWLYQHGPDSTWLRRVPCTWGAADALHYLRDAGALMHWQRLVSTCPGW